MNFRMISALAAIVLLSGCTTSSLIETPPVPGQVSSSGYPVAANFKAMNSGVFLFYFLPLWTGSPGRPDQRDYDLFLNQLRPKYARMMMDARLERLEADAVEDFRIRNSASGWWTLWIFWKRSFYASGVAVRHPVSGKNAPAAKKEKP